MQPMHMLPLKTMNNNQLSLKQPTTIRRHLTPQRQHWQGTRQDGGDGGRLGMGRASRVRLDAGFGLATIVVGTPLWAVSALLG